MQSSDPFIASVSAWMYPPAAHGEADAAPSSFAPLDDLPPVNVGLWGFKTAMIHGCAASWLHVVKSDMPHACCAACCAECCKLFAALLWRTTIPAKELYCIRQPVLDGKHASCAAGRRTCWARCGRGWRPSTDRSWRAFTPTPAPEQFSGIARGPAGARTEGTSRVYHMHACQWWHRSVGLVVQRGSGWREDAACQAFVKQWTLPEIVMPAANHCPVTR